MNSKNKSEGNSLAFVTFDSPLVDVPLTHGGLILGHLYMLLSCYRGSKRSGDQAWTRLI